MASGQIGGVSFTLAISLARVILNSKLLMYFDQKYNPAWDAARVVEVMVWKRMESSINTKSDI